MNPLLRLPFSRLVLPPETLLHGQLVLLIGMLLLGGWSDLKEGPPPLLPWLLGGAAGILIWTGSRLRAPALLYAAFGCVTGAVASFAAWHPAFWLPWLASMGAFGAAWGIWGILFWLRHPLRLGGERPVMVPGLSFLGQWEWVDAQSPNAAAMAVKPLRHGLWFSWWCGLAGMAMAFAYPAPNSLPVAVAAMLGAGVAGLLAGDERIPGMLFPGYVLALTAILIATPLPWEVTAALGIPMLWGGGLWALSPGVRWPARLRWQGRYAAPGGRIRAFRAWHQSGLLAALGGCGWIVLTGLEAPRIPLSSVLALALFSGFFAFAGWRLLERGTSYFALVGIGLTWLAAWAWWTETPFLDGALGPEAWIGAAWLVPLFVWLARRSSPRWRRLYREPLMRFAWGLLASSVAMAAWLGTPAGGLLPWALGLAVAGMALSTAWPSDARSVWLLAVLTWVGEQVLHPGQSQAFCAAFLLAALSGLVPRWNRLLPGFALGRRPWEWAALGVALLAVFSGALALEGVRAPALWFLFTWVMQTRLPWPWLAWSGAFALTGLGFGAVLELADRVDLPDAVGIALWFAWLNGLPYLPWLQDAVARRLGLDTPNPFHLPLYFWPALTTATLFLCIFALTTADMLGRLEGGGLLALGGGLAGISLGHFLWLRPSPWLAHGTWFALLNGWLLAVGESLPWPLVAAGWLLLALQLHALAAWGGEDSAVLDELKESAPPWFFIGMIAGLVALMITPPWHGPPQLLALALLGGSALWLGRGGDGAWRALGAGLIVTSLHGIWMAWHADPKIWLSWFAAQNALLGLAWWVYRPADGRYAQMLLGLSVGFWVWYAWVMGQDSLGLFHHGAAWLALGGYAAWVHRSFPTEHQPEPRYLGFLFLLILAALDARWWLLGWHAPTVGDTLFLLAAAVVARVVPGPAASAGGVRLALPALALATIPWQWQSLPATFTAWAVAALYWSQGARFPRLATLFALLALNLGVYAWIPLGHAATGALQFWIAPAALSVLILLHGHRLDLPPVHRHRVRLAALSLLYAGALLDVFTSHGGLGLFLVALCAALAGVGVGIALRIRAFLYAGSAFLVVLTLAQAIHFGPDLWLGRGITLILLGGLITAGMLWFNLQREAILRRWQWARRELAGWE